MKITSVEPIVLKIPFTDGSSGAGLFPTAWTHLEIVLVRIGTEAGLVGWGEGFGYSCSAAVADMVRGAVAPMLIGRELTDPAVLSEEMQRRMVLPGRYGISIFALSGADIALWDLRAKAEGVPVSHLLGKRVRSSVPAYASLVRYGDGDLMAKHAERALQEGFKEIKVHEITMPEIRRCRAVVGNDVPVTVDVNCNWSEAFTRQVTPELAALKLRWLEEPVFPPEDFRLLAALRTSMLPIAAGENACTAMQFAEMIRLGAVDYLQTSVTKVGGISEYEKIRALNEPASLPMAPHSPYFGPGYLATLHLAAVDPRFTVFEYLYIQPEAWLYPGFPLLERGDVRVPDGPGLGLEPDQQVIARYRVK
jgi:L-alanine-DL-glutamate epimerase-like enolase superfamily enzyme